MRKTALLYISVCMLLPPFTRAFLWKKMKKMTIILWSGARCLLADAHWTCIFCPFSCASLINWRGIWLPWGVCLTPAVYSPLFLVKIAQNCKFALKVDARGATWLSFLWRQVSWYFKELGLIMKNTTRAGTLKVTCHIILVFSARAPHEKLIFCYWSLWRICPFTWLSSIALAL